ncbi:hypothetical protein MPSEU_000943000 [Mayamaea pseudoterrestris]|nr:hypothetical protein MPSEU_000943000 [Mayamaea pseudoterrestris]
MRVHVPLYNLLLSITTLVYVDRVVELVTSIQKRGKLSILQSRKLIHLAATSTVIGWPFFDESHWTWRLAGLTCGLYSVKLLLHGLGLVKPTDANFFRTMKRQGQPSELLQGPLLFAGIIFLVCNYEFKTELGTYLIAAMGIGDGLAPLVGTLFPWRPYPSFDGERKTLSGSLAMLTSTLVGILLMNRLLGAPSRFEIGSAVQVALVATLAEAASGAWDNLAIPMAIVAYTKIMS